MTFHDAAGFRLTFGKHQGLALDQVATTDAGLRYCDWLRGELEAKHGRRRAYEEQTLEALRVYLDDTTIAADLAKLARSGR